VRAHDCRRPDVVAGGRLDLGLGRGLRSPEFEAFGVDQAQSREMFVESLNLIRRTWADENFVHHGKYWTVVKNGPLLPPLVQRPHRRSWSARLAESPVRTRLPAGGEWIRTSSSAREALSRFDESWPLLRRVEQTDPGKKII
jgi:alkanesulfonate monooxygenase SsuD/methylene tetrahydromethanopterin reductase-like flavin-dependent oxidoreductase (luciferase family)